jgi:hypothetical protein
VKPQADAVVGAFLLTLFMRNLMKNNTQSFIQDFFYCIKKCNRTYRTFSSFFNEEHWG